MVARTSTPLPAFHIPAPVDRLARARRQIENANRLLNAGAVDESLALTEACLAALGHRRRPGTFARIISILLLLLENFLPRRSTHASLLRDEVALETYSLALIHYQLVGQNLAQLEYALRYILLGRRSPDPKVLIEVEAIQLLLLAPLRQLGPAWQRRAVRAFARLEALVPRVAGERPRCWPSLLRALHLIVDGRPDLARRYFEAIRDRDLAHGSYIALQRGNALFLAADYDRYIDEVVPEARASCDGRTALATARWAWVLHTRGERKAARRLGAAAAGLPLDEVPWAHRSLLLYQLVELDLLEGDTRAAAHRATLLADRIHPAAISPVTGAFECLDALVRAYVAEALRLRRTGDPRAAQTLLASARRALRRAPLLCPPLFAPRLAHLRGIVSLAAGHAPRALRHLEHAATLAEATHVPACTIRILDDLIHLRFSLHLPPGPAEPRAAALSTRHGLPRRTTPAPWLAEVA